jgi:hypothetical protein
MIITADNIRSFPFANDITRVPDDIQILIARDMAEQAHKEGHRKRLPTVTSQKAEDIALARAIIEADVWRYLVKFGPGTITAIRNSIKRDRHKIDNALVYMVADGRVKRLNRPTRGGSVPAVFQINPYYSPTQGQCDPAQPGNPTGTRSDVTTVEPLTGPGALEPLPATGGM